MPIKEVMIHPRKTRRGLGRRKDRGREVCPGERGEALCGRNTGVHSRNVEILSLGEEKPKVTREEGLKAPSRISFLSSVSRAVGSHQMISIEGLV